MDAHTLYKTYAPGVDLSLAGWFTWQGGKAIAQGNLWGMPLVVLGLFALRGALIAGDRANGWTR